MEKLAKAIEFLAPILLVYPRWAQVLFVLTVALLLLSLGAFLVLLPAAKSRYDDEKSSINQSSFAVTSPTAGAFVTDPQLTIHGTGADPERSNTVTVRFRHIRTGGSKTISGEFFINSDRTWRFEYVEFSEPGPTISW